MASFSIEATGEAVPLEPSSLLYVLLAAASIDQQQIKSATQQLDNWASQAGYHAMLFQLIGDRMLPFEARYMASIQLKNIVSRLWRKGPAGSIREDDKQMMRSQVIDLGMQEEDRRLLLQIALLLGVIVRHDFPRFWLQVFHTIDAKLKNEAAGDRTPRLLLLLLHVTKNAMVSRVKSTRQALHEATHSGIFRSIFDMYLSLYSQCWNMSAGNIVTSPGELRPYAEESLLCLRILRRLAESAFPEPERSPDFTTLWEKSYEQFLELASYLFQDTGKEFRMRQPIAEAHARQLAKLHYNVSLMASPEFSYAVLPQAANLTIAYWSLAEQYGRTVHHSTTAEAEAGKIKSLEFLCLKALLLVRSAVKTSARLSKGLHNDPVGRKQMNRDARLRLEALVFLPDRVRSMVDVLIMQYFMLSQKDLEAWQEDPEEWQRQQEGSDSDWEHLVRPCAERLLLDLSFNFGNVVKTPLIGCFAAASSMQMDDIQLDAVLCAMGLAASCMSQEIDMSAFLLTKVPFLRSRFSVDRSWRCSILKRRLVLLTAKWSSVGLSRAVKPLVYQLYHDLLAPENDLAVRITAGHRLDDVVMEIGFEPRAFLPFCKMTGLIMQLVYEVEAVDTKLELLQTVQTVVQQMGLLISDYALEVFDGMGLIWDRAGEEYLIKQRIISTMAELLQSTQGNGQRFHGTAAPLIASVVEVGSPLQPFLLEEVLELWKSLLTSADSPTSETIQLVPLLFPLLEFSGSTLERAVALLDSYILLAPSQMLSSEVAPLILSSAAALFGNLQMEVFQSLMLAIDDLLQMIPSIGGLDLLSTIAQQMAVSGLLAKTRADLRKAWEADHQTVEKRVRGRSLLELRLARSHLGMYARICLYSPEIFITTMRLVAQEAKEDFDSMMTWILQAWTENLDIFLSFNERKLHCLALTQLLETRHRWILDRIGDLVALWTQLVGEVQANRTVDLIEWLHELDADPAAITSENRRRRALDRNDAAKTADLEDVVKGRIQTIQAEVGGSAAFTHGLQGVVSEDTLLEFSKLGLQ